ncbi:MAG TPA: galactokinase family protein [Blastocatellia bacterium]|nr:galactokinase family protein [Blastocatellia bacterium]
MTILSGEPPHLSDTAAFVGLLESLPSELRGFFSSGREVIVTRAPGRLDLMGGIADYSGSLVLQLPIANATHAALQREGTRELRIVSLAADSGESRSFAMSLDELMVGGEVIGYEAARARFDAKADEHWAAYVAGAFLVLRRERGAVFNEGARILIRSDVPEGKGVSSSAALEVAAMSAIAAAFEITLAPRELAFLCQKVENLVAGAPCGVMDQMTAACGEADRLLALLCQPGEVKGTISLPDELAVWGIDSGIRHSVGGADYGTVRTAAFMGCRIIAELAGLPVHKIAEGRVVIDDARWRGYPANLTPQEFETDFAAHLPASMTGAEFLSRYGGITDAVTTVQPERTYPVLQATRHPIYEHARVTAFARILQNWRESGEAETLGELMYESHASYSACGLGSAGTDALVELVRAAGAGLYGAKITGGGSGGTVAVLGRREAAGAVREIAQRYTEQSGLVPLIISGSSPGAGAFGHLRLMPD